MFIFVISLIKKYIKMALQTQKQDIQKEIKTLEVMLSHATMMGDTKNQKTFEEKIFWLKSTLTHIE